MKRLAPVIAGLLALIWAIPASAASVSRDYSPLPDLIEDTTCGFVVDVTFPVNREYAISFYDNAGNLRGIQITGRLVVTFANPANDKSVTANISGPVSIAADGSTTATGRGGGPLPGLVGLLLFAGRTSASGSDGHVFLDLCAALS